MAIASKIYLIVEVLQNGISITKIKKPLNNNTSITLESSSASDLHIPLYHLINHIKIFEIKHKKVLLEWLPIWQGFLVHKGKSVVISQENPSSETYELSLNDYGCINFHDLQILFKIQKEQPSSSSIKHDFQYKDNLFKFWFETTQETSALLLSVIVTLILLIGAISWTVLFPHKVPSSLVDIEQNYLLNFIHPDHLRTAPEALKFNLHRTNYPSSVIKFYQNFVNLNLGEKVQQPEFFYPQSLKMYEKLHQTKEQNIAQKIHEQQKIEEQFLQKPYTTIVSVPAVKSESLKTSLYRINDKISILHKSYALSLKKRRHITSVFYKDPFYNYEEYRNVEQKDSKEQFLSQITPFHLMTDEATMYAVAEKLAKKAQALQKISNHVIKNTELTPVISIPYAVSFVSFTPVSNIRESEAKISKIIASEFGKIDNKPKVKEPLVGEIEPHLIEKVIRAKRIDLQLCYESALKKNKFLEGKTQWSWVITTQGKASQIQLIYTDIKDDKMLQCIKDRISTWTFPRPHRGSVVVQYPFIFKSDKG